MILLCSVIALGILGWMFPSFIGSHPIRRKTNYTAINLLPTPTWLVQDKSCVWANRAYHTLNSGFDNGQLFEHSKNLDVHDVPIRISPDLHPNRTFELTSAKTVGQLYFATDISNQVSVEKELSRFLQTLT